jgi:hypothetical protein
MQSLYQAEDNIRPAANDTYNNVIYKEMQLRSPMKARSRKASAT